jgi:hypothetical protein
MTTQHASQCVEQYFELQRSVNDRKGAVAKRGQEFTNILTVTGLAGSNHNGWWGLIEPPE